MGRGRSDSRSRSGGRDGDGDRIQQMVDERQAARRDRDFDKADRMREELKDMGVRIDDTQLTWNAPGGLRGVVNNPGGKGPIERREGDWSCPNCGKLVFAAKDTCFSCGEPRPSGDRGYNGGRGGRRRRDDSRDDRRRRRREESRPRGRGRRRRRDRDYESEYEYSEEPRR
ncbi:cysS [Symbiodinium pilosum]|uniref:CysS protein n=1 Tax=Symbiodinium pilosum TaxID=2952 RepID=A0A812T5M7_SYMPI|nr:cysS [Symbiodinium pilosum]